MTKEKEEVKKGRIIKLLEHSELTHDRIAEYTGSSQPYVSKLARELDMERKKTAPDAKTTTPEPFEPQPESDSRPT